MDLIYNENLFHTVFDSASNGIAVLESVYNQEGKVEDFTVLLFNEFTRTWIGDLDYKGKKYSELFPKVIESGILEKFIETAHTGISATFEQWYDGEEMSSWLHFTAVKQENLVIVTTEDVTEKKLSERILKRALDDAERQERLYNSIISSTPDLVYVFDTSYIFTYANKALLDMWGKNAEDAIGKGLRDNGYEEWHALMHEREIDQVVLTKKPIRGTVSFPHAEFGERIYDYILVPVLNQNGDVEAVAGTTRDITEISQAEEKIKQSETRLRKIIEQSPIGILLSRGEEVIIENVNKPMLDFINKNTDIIGKKIIEALPELDGQEVLQTVLDVQKTGLSFRGDEFPVDLLSENKLERRYFNFSYDRIEEAGQDPGVLHMAVDVTEHVLARIKLEDSESRLRSMIDQTPCPMLVLKGADLVIEQINKHMVELIGRGDQIVGMPLIEVLPELEGQYVWEQVQNVYSNGIYFDQSEVLVRHNRTGTILDYYYNLAYRPLIEQGAITGMIQVAVDVTEQVTARKKLEESENRFRALVNASSDMVYRMNADWTIMQNLDGAGVLSNAVEPVANWLQTYIHPEDRQRVSVLIERAISEKSIFELEHRVVTTEGGLGWTFSRAVPILDDNGNIIEWFGSTNDITTQKELQRVIKESEEKFRQLADLVPQAIWTAQPDGFTDYYNKRWYEYTGFENNQYGDNSWVPVVHPNDAPLVLDAWYKSVKEGTAYQIEFRLKKGETGEYRWFLSKALPIRDKAGVITKWFGTSTDIHEQKTITEKLEVLVAERTKELQRSNEDLQQFAHVASHDLKEPVRKMKTFTGRLEDHLKGVLDNTAERYIDRIHVAADRMNSMIDGVLAYSKINADLQVSTLVDLNEVLKNIETDLEVSLQKSGGKIEYHNLPEMQGAQVLLYQLFYNLINNSIKFAKDDIPPLITISSERKVENNKNYAVITLEDNGIGFDSEQADRIFETFIRLNSKDKYEGTGLGLALCKKIAERHGGTIKASSIPGKGASFIITLPLEQIEKDI